MTTKTHFPSEETLDRCATALEAMVGLSGATVSDYESLRALVRTGQAARHVSPGDQLIVPYKDDSRELDLRFDVLHHFDGSDDAHPLIELADGTKAPGLMLGMHNAFPDACVFCPKQAFFYATADMAAGTYSFTVNTTAKWGSGVAGEIGSVTYRFTTTKAMKAGYQLVWNASYNAKPTSATVYSGPSSADAMETVAITVGSGGTSLGTMSEESSDAGLNNIERACEGSNNWQHSQLRLWLNSEGAVTPSYTKFDRPFDHAGKAGFLKGLDASFVRCLATVKRSQETHAFDGGAVETVADRMFPVSAREHGFNNYLSATTDGFKAEGVPLDYWTGLRSACGRTSWNGWATYPELITYDAASPTTARGVWLRSAYRYRGNASNVGCVNASGDVGSAYANYGLFAVPACVIA